MWRFGTRPRQSGAAQPAPAWVWGPADAVIASGLLALTVAVCVPLGYHFHSRAAELDKRIEETSFRLHALRTTLERVEARRTDLSRLRREVNRYVADVETRPLVPWTTVVGELSRRRPEGLWTTRITGNGAQFRAQVSAMTPDLVGAYARHLRESPYVEFAALPAGDAPNGSQVVGRMMGE